MPDAFEEAGSLLLFVAGGAMVVLAVAVEDRDTVAAALVGFGSALMSLGVLLPRLVGRLKVGIQGLEAELISAVQQQAEAKGLSAEETQRAVETAQTESEAWRAWLKERVAEAALESGSATQTEPTHVREPILQLAQRYVERARESGSE